MILTPECELTFGDALVQVWPDCVRTVFADCVEVVGAPQDNDAYRATAERLGYGADTLRLCRTHEVVHSWLASLLGLPESPALRGAANGSGPSLLTGAEEDAVMAVERLANLAGVDLLGRIQRL